MFRVLLRLLRSSSRPPGRSNPRHANHNAIPTESGSSPATSSVARRASDCRYGGALHGLCGGTDHVNHKLGVGEHRDVAAVDLVGGGAHTLGHGALQIGMHGAVFFADDVPARLRLPSGSPDSRLEQVGFGDALGRPNELLLLLRKVSAEILR